MFSNNETYVAPIRALMAGTSIAWTLLLLSLCGLLPSKAFGQDHPHDAHRKVSPVSEIIVQQQGLPAKKAGRIELPKASLEIPDIWLLDQHGKRVRLYSDLIKGKVVVVNFFYTSCTYICPMQGKSLSRLKTALAGRLGRDVFFVSISQDPEIDTTDRLKKWGETFGVSSGWTLVTGEKTVISKLLWEFTGSVIGQEMHESMVLIGNEKTGVWTTLDGLSLPEDLVKVIDRVSRS